MSRPATVIVYPKQKKQSFYAGLSSVKVHRMPVLMFEAADEASFKIIQRGKQGDGAVTNRAFTAQTSNVIQTG